MLTTYSKIIKKYKSRQLFVRDYSKPQMHSSKISQSQSKMFKIAIAIAEDQVFLNLRLTAQGMLLTLKMVKT